MKGFVLGFITAILLVAAAAYAYLTMGLADVRSDAPASQVENYLTHTAVRASVLHNAPELHSPVPATDVNLVTGGRMYLDQCARCHGTPGRTNDLESSTSNAPQFPKVGTQYTESQVFWISKHGIRGTGMVASSSWGSDEELWALAAYIKRMNHLPAHVREELARATQTNPASAPQQN